MIPLILGLSSAALFLGMSASVYGVSALWESPWVSMVLLGLVGAGLAVSLLGHPVPGWLRRLPGQLKSVQDLCPSLGPCR
jgi:hypothetical protein